ncbi:beta-ketoacyl-[acyl-carrier-protein] synthase family protein [Gorillibacterium sp. CAU 1737]|uniref:beta-ketoacyl-[acyl-carrier-protein] synthase family protein n=1 Tax=Gorillibacterium sp. CAU 1737 TaxID=3140362 RepID=UPI003260EBE6
MSKRVVVTGMGLLTPLGNTLETFWENSLNAMPAYDKLEQFMDMDLKSKVAGVIPEFDYLGRTADPSNSEQMGRPTVLAVNSAIRAVRNARLDWSAVDRERVGVCMANAIADTPYSEKSFLELKNEQGYLSYSSDKSLPSYKKGMFSFIANEIAEEFGLMGECFVMSTGCTGGIDAIGYGFDSIRSGDHDIMLCGASEAPITYMTIASFDAIGALSVAFNDEPKKASRPFDRLRNGFVLSEGSAVLVLEELEHAVKREATIYGEIVSFSSTNNAYHMTDLPTDGDALAQAMNLAFMDSGLEPTDVDYINAHGSSTPQNDYFETAAIKKAFGEHAYQIPISSTKSMVGHPLSAASAIEIIHCFLAMKEGIAPPTANWEVRDPGCDLNYVPNKGIPKPLSHVMTNASGFSGIHSVMLLSNTEKSDQVRDKLA